MIWVDQPIGTGFSPAAEGAPYAIQNETDVGRDFAGFWKNFMTTFDLTGRKVYITGESYAGQYIPYIAMYMLEQNNTDYYNVAGIQINDPSIGIDSVLREGRKWRSHHRSHTSLTKCSTCSCTIKRIRKRVRPQ